MNLPAIITWMAKVEIVKEMDYDEYVRAERDRLERLARWYRATYERRPRRRKKPRHPAEERLIEKYRAWERENDG
jgi:hypothetical protein